MNTASNMIDEENMKRFWQAAIAAILFSGVGSVVFAQDSEEMIAKAAKAIMIIQEDGSIYEMSTGESVQWEFFIRNTKRAKYLEAVLVKITPTTEYGALYKVNIQVKQQFVSGPQSFDDYVWSKKKKVNMDRITEIVKSFIDPQ